MFGDPRQLDTNWPCYTLRDCCAFYAGTGFPTEYQGLSEGDLPFYKVGDISREVQSGRRELGRADNYVSTSVANKLKGKIIPTKTIVFAKIGESLKLNRRAFTSVPSLIDNNVMGIKANDQRLLDTFLFFVMRSVDLGSLSSSTAVPSVRKSTLEKVSIGLPPLELQRVFSDFVIEVDKLRFDVQQQIEKLQTLKKSLMQEYFG